MTATAPPCPIKCCRHLLGKRCVSGSWRAGSCLAGLHCRGRWLMSGAVSWFAQAASSRARPDLRTLTLGYLGVIPSPCASPLAYRCVPAGGCASCPCRVPDCPCVVVAVPNRSETTDGSASPSHNSNNQDTDTSPAVPESQGYPSAAPTSPLAAAGSSAGTPVGGLPQPHRSGSSSGGSSSAAAASDAMATASLAMDGPAMVEIVDSDTDIRERLLLAHFISVRSGDLDLWPCVWICVFGDGNCEDRCQRQCARGCQRVVNFWSTYGQITVELQAKLHTLEVGQASPAVPPQPSRRGSRPRRRRRAA